MVEIDYLTRNRAFWDSRAHAYAKAGERNWSEAPSWAIWRCWWPVPRELKA